MLEKIKNYYEAGIWSKEMVKQLVKTGKIMPSEYEAITQEEYVD